MIIIITYPLTLSNALKFISYPKGLHDRIKILIAMDCKWGVLVVSNIDHQYAVNLI